MILRSKETTGKLIHGTRQVSKPGATIVVKEIILTDLGRKAITSGSRGIKEGALEEHGPPPLRKQIAPA